MIEQLDQKTKERVNKAIGNIRLIASRSKRTNVLDATQRAETVVRLLDYFRKYINAHLALPFYAIELAPLRDLPAILENALSAAEEAGNIYHALSHSKQVSYREEYKQVFLLLGDLGEYLKRIINAGGPHA